MRRILGTATCVATLAVAAAPALAADVGVSIEVSQPGVYGRIDIGRFPQPAVVVAKPVIIARPHAAPPPPVYLWVPPGHQKHWSRHCHEYKACGVPVYFVREDWYREHVMAGRPGPEGGGRGEGPGRGEGHGKGHGKDHGKRGD